MHKHILEDNLKELSTLRPPLLAKLRLKYRIWLHFLRLKRAQGNVLLRFSKAIAFACIAVLLTGSLGYTTIYAYRSDDITAFDTLYPVKQIIENWTLTWSQSPLDRAEIYLDLATKRSREVQKQLELKQKIDPATLVAIKDNNEQAIIAAQQITDQNAKKVFEKKIVQVSHEQVNTLKAVKAAGVKLAAEAKSIPLQQIAKQDISLGTPDFLNNQEGTEIQLGIASTSETIIASHPELKLVDNILNDTKKFTEERIVEAQLDNSISGESVSASGTTLLDFQSESVSLSSDLP